MLVQQDSKWPLGLEPGIHLPLPDRMYALTIHRDCYGRPADVIHLEEVDVPALHPENATQVLVAILATGPNFNTNFAALGLPVPVFGRGDGATVHIPGSDALGIVVAAGSAVRTVRTGQAVILDSWTGGNIRGYETHDGFNAQFALVEQERAIPVPPALLGQAPERLAAVLLTYGTAYRAIVERLRVGPGDTVLLMGGGKGTSFAGAQIATALGARVILMGSNPTLGQSLIDRGIAHGFVDRRQFAPELFGVIAAETSCADWQARSAAFRQAVYTANGGQPVSRIFDHTGGRNFPLLVSALAAGGALAFFGATGGGLKGEYKETFFYGGQRFVCDARWVWMRQKQVLFRRAEPPAILAEIGLLPGRRGLVWGADDYATGFCRAALARGANLAVIASRSREAAGIAGLLALGIPDSHIIDRDRFTLPADMPDPLTEDGRANPAYAAGFMEPARGLGRAVWEVFGGRASPDFVVDRPHDNRLHFSTFLARDYDERDEMPCSVVIVKGETDLSILGSHMYRSSQAREVVRLLAEGRIVMEPEDLDVTTLSGLPAIQQNMLDGRMIRPKGVALVQARDIGRSLADYEAAYLGQVLRVARPEAGEYLGLHWHDGVAIVTIERPAALNALDEALLAQLSALAAEVERSGSIEGRTVGALLLRGAGRAFMAGADVAGFVGQDAAAIAGLAGRVLEVYGRLERLRVPVVALIDGFALGGGSELAMSLRYRVVTENTTLGQPEVKLGIMPGYGGMQRLPRLIGPWRAASMAANGEPIDGHTAVAWGLADAFHPSAMALREAFQVARALAAGAGPAPRRDWDAVAAGQAAELADLLAQPRVIDLLAAPALIDAEASDLAAARRYAARVALEALATGYRLGFAAGLANDARLFGGVTASPSGQHWIRRFLAKDPRQAALLTLLAAPAV